MKNSIACNNYFFGILIISDTALNIYSLNIFGILQITHNLCTTTPSICMSYGERGGLNVKLFFIIV